MPVTSDAEFWDARADRVSLLTLHAAKGLEFAVVFIVGLEDGLLPLRWDEADEEEMAEERRLFYVAVTRARHRLTLNTVEHKRSKPSPFLDDILMDAQIKRRDIDDVGNDVHCLRPHPERLSVLLGGLRIGEEGVRQTQQPAAPSAVA